MAQRIFELIFKGSTSALESASKSAVDALDKVGDEMDDVAEKAVDAGRETAELGHKLYDTAEAGGSAEQAFNGITDLMSVMTEQFGISLGPLTEYTGALAQVGGGVEALLKGGPEFIQAMVAMTASVWAQVTALYAQAAAFVVANAPIILIIASLALLAAGVYLVIQHWDTITEKVPILKTALDGIVTFFNTVLLPAFTAIWEKGLQPVIDFVTDHWQLIGAIILAPFLPLVLIATDGFGIRTKLVDGFQKIIDWFTNTWATVKGMITSPFDDLLEGAKTAFGVASALGSAFDGVVGMVQTALSGLWAAVGAIVNPVIDAYNGSIGQVPGVPNIPRFGGGGSGSDSSTGYDPNQRGSSGGGADPGQLSGMSQELSRNASLNSPGGMGKPSSPGYQDPRGVTLTASDIMAWHNSPTFGQVGNPAPQVIQLVVDGAVLAQAVNRENARGY